MLREWTNKKGYTLRLMTDEKGEALLTLEGPGNFFQVIRRYEPWHGARSTRHAESLAEAMSAKEAA